MTKERIQTGKRGEHIAISYLKNNGYKIITQNYRNRFGEIDIIAKDSDTLAFVEIKTRRIDTAALGPPQIAVNPKKQRKIIKASIVYIKQKNISNMRFRFDVIAVTILPDGSLKENGIDLIKNAFQTRGC